MKNGIVWAVICMIVCMSLFACGGGGASSDTNISGDGISITSISPASAIANQDTPFEVEVSYSLTSKDSGLLMVGFNTTQVDSFSMMSSQTYTVAKGSGTHTFNVTTTAVNWGSAGSFQAYVNLSENPHSTQWTPLASHVKTISISPSAANALMTTGMVYHCNNGVCR